jgi:hypothetical protein
MLSLVLDVASRLLLRAEEPWVVEDLPEVSVGIAKVAGVDPPWTVVRPVGERGTGGLGLGEQGVDLGFACDRVSDAELAGLRWRGPYVAQTP